MQDHLRILKPFLRGFPIVILFIMISIGGAKKYLSYVTPMYESTAKIKLADIGEGVPNSNLYKNLDVFASANKIAAEIEVIKSSELINKALEKLDFGTEIYRIGRIQTVELYHNSPILINITNPTNSILDRRLRLTIKSEKEYEVFDANGQLITTGKIDVPLFLLDNEITISLNDELISNKKDVKIIDNYEFEFLSKEKLLEKTNKNIDVVSTDKDVAVIRINLKNNVPEKAAAFVNTLAEAYIHDYIENKYYAASVTVSFLDKQITDASVKLTSAENKIEEYRNVNNIVNLHQETETDLRKISQLKIQLANVEMNLDAIDALNRYIKSGKDNFLTLAPNFEAFNDLLSTEIIKNIKKLQAEKKDLSLVFTSSDERVMVIDDKIKDLTNYLIESIQNTKNNLQIKYDDLLRNITEAEAVFETVPEKEKNLTIMNRDFNLLQTSYNFLNEKKIEAEIAQAAKISFHRVISPALVADKPISPNRPIIIIVAALLGLFLSLFGIYTVHLLKAKVNDVYSIERKTNIPVSATTPYVKGNNEIVFERVLTQLELKGIVSPNSVLTFTSNGDSEGKVFNLLGICRAIGKQNRKVLIIDVKGNLSFLKTEICLETELFDTSISNTFYTTINSKEGNSLSVDSIKHFVESQKQNADVILINNEYLKEESKALIMMKIADHNIFVVDSRATSLKLISRLDFLIREFNIINISVLLNKAGYNPSVIKEVYNWTYKLIHRKNEKK